MENFQANIVERNDINVTISVEVPSKDVSSLFKKIMQSLSHQVRIPGFRPGKAPRRVILSQIGGEEVLQQEVRSHIFENIIPQAVQKLELHALSISSVGEDAALPQADEAFTFTFVCEIFPTVELPDYREIVLDQEKEEVTDDDVNAFIDNLRERFAIMDPVDGRPVQEKDVVILGLQSSPEGNGLPLDLNTAEAEIIDQLVGKEMNEEFELSLNIPRKDKTPDDGETTDSDNDASDNDASENEPEKLAVFVQDIRSKILPERDNEFAETLGQDNWEQVEENIRGNLQTERDAQVFNAQTNEFVEKLLELTDISIPNVVMKDARDNVLLRIESRVKEQGWTMREYRKELEAKGELEDFEMQVQESTYTEAKRDLVLGALLEKEGTTLDNQEFENILERSAQEDGISLRKFKKGLGESGLNNYRYILRRNRAVENVVKDILGINA